MMAMTPSTKSLKFAAKVTANAVWRCAGPGRPGGTFALGEEGAAGLAWNEGEGVEAGTTLGGNAEVDFTGLDVGGVGIDQG